MRVRFLTWFLFVSCTQAISNSGLHTNLSSEQRGLNSSIINAQTQPPFENYGSIKETMRLDKKDGAKQGLLYASIIKTAHAGGRGAGGGTNDNRHRRHPANSAPPLLSWSSTMCVCLTLVLMLFFHVELL